MDQSAQTVLDCDLSFKTGTMASALDIFKLLGLTFWYYLEALFRFIVPRAPKDISGQVVLVTGAGKGIGRCMAIRFARQGAKLAVLDVDKVIISIFR